MGNTATLAPRFTRENAAEMARRAAASRSARVAREKAAEAERDIRARALAITRETLPDPDDARKARVQKQIDLLITDMERSKDLDLRLRLGTAIERLWKLVQTTPGQQRKRGAGRPEAPAMPDPVPSSTPQAGV